MQLTKARGSRRPLAYARWAIVAFCLAGCSRYGGLNYYSLYPVATVYGAVWIPNGHDTFSVARYPWRGDAPPPPEIDPRRDNSVTQRAITEQIRTSFAERGYKPSDQQGDVDVVVYASTDPQLNISGYTHDYDWKNVPLLKNKTVYPKGTVVVDVLTPKTHELLWRGSTVAAISSDAEKYQAGLRQAVERIVAKFPKATH